MWKALKAQVCFAVRLHCVQAHFTLDESRPAGKDMQVSESGRNIVVVGAGIVGASIAWHLAREGAGVTIVDAAKPGGVATANSFSWINSNHSFARPYFELRHRSMAEWRRLSAELPQLPVSISGSLYLPEPGLDLDAFVAVHRSWGYRISLVDGDAVRRREPHLAIGVDRAAFAEDEGAGEASDIARLLVEAAVGAGARLKGGTAVEGLALGDAGIAGVRTGSGVVGADTVVIAAGVATPGLLAGAGYEFPFTTPPGLLAHTETAPPLVNGVILAEGLHIRQKRDGALLIGVGRGEGLMEGDDPDAHARELMERLGALIDGAGALKLARYSLGHRPTPGDGLPVIGPVPGVAGLYMAVMHSGVTLAPAVGQLAARELLRGARDDLLAPFAPERFLAQPSAAAGE